MMNFGREYIWWGIVVLLLIRALYLVISTKKTKKLKKQKHFLQLTLLISVIFWCWYFAWLFPSVEQELVVPEVTYTHWSAERIVDEKIIEPVIQPVIQHEEFIPVWIDISTIKSAPAEKEWVTMCSKTARITLRSLTSKSYEMHHGDNIAQWDAISLIELWIESWQLEEISFKDWWINPSTRLFEMLAHDEYEIADIYLYRDDSEYGPITQAASWENTTMRSRYLEQAHRFVVVLWSDGVLYALDPYRGWVWTAPQRFVDYVSLIPDWTMYIWATYNAEVDQSVLTYYESNTVTYKAIQPQQEQLPTVEQVQWWVAWYLQVKKPKVRIEDIVQNESGDENDMLVDEVGSLLGL